MDKNPGPPRGNHAHLPPKVIHDIIIRIRKYASYPGILMVRKVCPFMGARSQFNVIDGKKPVKMEKFG